MDGEQNVVIKVTEIVEEPGKPIYLTFKDKPYQILLDRRCLGKDTDVCKPCKLKFRCYSSDALYVNVDDDLMGLRTPTEKPALNQVLDIFLRSQGVDLTITSACDKIEE